MNILELILCYQRNMIVHGAIKAYHHLVEDMGVSTAIADDISSCFNEDGEPIDALGYRLKIELNP